jgi:hypothetical protein
MKHILSSNTARIRVATLLLASALLAGCGGGGDGGDPLPQGTPTVANLVFDGGVEFDLLGARVYVDDVFVGFTGPGGELPIQVPNDGFVRVLAGTSFQGEVEMDGAVPGALVIPMRGDIERFARVAINQAQGGVLSIANSAVTLRVLGRKDRAIALASTPAPQVLLRDRFNGDEIDVSNLFAIASGGRLVATDPEEVLSDAASLTNDVEFVVRGADLDGATFDTAESVLIGQHDVRLELESPPSFPGLPVNGIQIALARIGSDLTRTGTSNGAGVLVFDDLPNGTYEITGATSAAGDTFTASGALFVNRDINVQVNLLGVDDVAAGVPAFELLTTPIQVASSIEDQRQLLEQQRSAQGAPIGPAGNGTISVLAAAEDQIVSASAQATIPQGTAKAQLEYEVETDEFPDFVQEQSEFNDNWTVKVLAPSGATLFSIARNVNQQLFIEPLWNETGTTGLIVRDIDVSALTATGEAVLTLSISATNIGDSAFATSVSARIAPSTLRIANIERDTVDRIVNCGNHAKPQNNQDGFSIPFAGDVNVRQRELSAVLVGRADDANITNVRVEVLSVDTGAPLATLFDGAPDDGFVNHVTTGGDDKVVVRVTNTSERPSQVAGSSPPASQEVRYRITVEAVAPGSSPQSATRESADFLALWRMPDLFTRTGCRDEGQDDWCSRAASIWLEDNGALLSAINDISGEHARNTGHATHGEGTDIDMRQYASGTFPTGSGGQIYAHLAGKVRDAMGGDAAATAEVDAWVLAQRSGIEPLIALPTVAQVLIGIGGTLPDHPMPDGWLKDLLRDGEFDHAGGTFSIPAGAWTDANINKVIPTGGHNDHHHVTLDLD